MIFVDSTELSGHTQRQLHAAWRELHGERLLVPPAVALEVAPRAAGAFRYGEESEAERELRRHPEVSGDRSKELRIQAWWARQWRKADGPYGVVVPSVEQEQLAAEIQRAIDKACFPLARPDEFQGETGDPRIVAETLALRGQMLLTSDINTIDRNLVNEWAVTNGTRLGFEPRDVVFVADQMLMAWTRQPAARERWLQAGLMAAWPADDNPSTEQVADATERAIRRMCRGTGGKLKEAGGQILNGLRGHPDLAGLIERTRAKLPGATNQAEGSTRHTSGGDGNPDPRKLAPWLNS